MALPGMVNPMEVVFSFDTTGSMSQALDEVKGRINDMVQRLQADIPGFRVGIIAHGDYCDAEHFYDIRSLDLSDNVADVVTFVNETDGTGGGDIPEAYELALRQAKRMSWRHNSRRILVVIGDGYPHEADYPLNVENIDWKTELMDLKAMNVRIYGVQVQNDENSTAFFQYLTYVTEGQHLQLANMGRICEVIMGICYREQGPDLLNNFEEEIRNKEADKFGSDLECMFGTLRSETSCASDVTAILENDEPEKKKKEEKSGKKRDTFLRPWQSKGPQTSKLFKNLDKDDEEDENEEDDPDFVCQADEEEDDDEDDGEDEDISDYEMDESELEKGPQMTILDLNNEEDENDDDDPDFVFGAEEEEEDDDSEDEELDDEDSEDEDTSCSDKNSRELRKSEDAVPQDTLFPPWPFTSPCGYAQQELNKPMEQETLQQMTLPTPLHARIEQTPNSTILNMEFDDEEDDPDFDCSFDDCDDDDDDDDLGYDSNDDDDDKPIYADRNNKKARIKTQKACKAKSFAKTNKDSRNRKPYREHITKENFKHRSLPWSSWYLAVCPKEQMKEKTAGHWKTISGCTSKESLWRSDLLDEIPDRHKSGRMVLELSIIVPGTHRRKVVCSHTTHPAAFRNRNGVLRLPWYRGVFHKVRPVLDKAVCHKCRVFIRWARVTPRWQNRIGHFGLREDYDYAWMSSGFGSCQDTRFSF